MAMMIAITSPVKETTVETDRMKTATISRMVRMEMVRMETGRSRTVRMETGIGGMAKETTAIPLPTKTISPMIAIMAVRMAETAKILMNRTMPSMA